MAQINSSGQSVPHACVICAPTIELALSEAEKLAAAAVCSGVGARPCGKCRDCRKAAEHVHPDIITVSRLLDDKGRPKREIGVDQIRDVIADAQVLPNEAARKVYIIDRAETMNAAAQNAALKLLEEPPAGAVFLLCTTNAMQLLPTVRSRCELLRENASDAEPSEDGMREAEAYLKAAARGDRAELLRWCAGHENLDAQALQDFLSAAKQALVRQLSGEDEIPALTAADAMRQLRRIEQCETYRRANVNTKHIFGLLSVPTVPDAAGKKRG